MVQRVAIGGNAFELSVSTERLESLGRDGLCGSQYDIGLASPPLDFRVRMHIICNVLISFSYWSPGRDLSPAWYEGNSPSRGSGVMILSILCYQRRGHTTDCLDPAKRSATYSTK